MYVLAAVAAVVTAASITFVIDGVRVSVPVPAGYCEPKGDLAASVREFHAADTRNITHLTLIRCDQMDREHDWTDYVLVKSPRIASGKEIPRTTFLQMLGEAVKGDAFTKKLESGDLEREIEEKLSGYSGQKVDVSTAIRPLGADDTCVYFGMAAGYTYGDGPTEVKIGTTCMTTVSNRVVFLYWYGSRARGDSISSLIARVRGLARSLKAP